MPISPGKSIDLSKVYPSDRRDQHDACTRPDRIDDPHRHRLQRERKEIESETIAEDRDDRRSEPGETSVALSADVAITSNAIATTRRGVGHAVAPIASAIWPMKRARSSVTKSMWSSSRPSYSHSP